MCNLADGIEEKAIERTVERVTNNMNENFVMNMYTEGYTFKQISKVTKLSVDNIEIIIENKKAL